MLQECGIRTHSIIYSFSSPLINVNQVFCANFLPSLWPLKWNGQLCRQDLWKCHICVYNERQHCAVGLLSSCFYLLHPSITAFFFAMLHYSVTGSQSNPNWNVPLFRDQGSCFSHQPNSLQSSRCYTQPETTHYYH